MMSRHELIHFILVFFYSFVFLNSVSATPSLTWFGASDPSPVQAKVVHVTAATASTAADSASGLPFCNLGNIFDFRLTIDGDTNSNDSSSSSNNNNNDATSIVEIVDTVTVNACRLNCQGHVIRSSVSQDRPILIVQNGGRVENCALLLVAPATNITARIPMNDGSDKDNLGSVGSGIGGGGGKAAIENVYVPTTGVVCNDGDCALHNVSCSVSLSARKEYRYVNHCIRVEAGAGHVDIVGGSVVDDYGEFGIVVNATNNNDDTSTRRRDSDDRTTTTTTLSGGSPTTVSIRDFQIRNQEKDAILILGGASSIQITDCDIQNNGGDGIEVRGGHGLDFLGIFGGNILENGDDGVDLDQSVYSKSNIVANKNNSINGAVMEVVIAGTTILNNDQDGILIQNANKVTLDSIVTKRNGDGGISVTRVNTLELNNVVANANVQNGLAVEAKDSVLTVTSSTFNNNGRADADETDRFERAGVYLWLVKEATFTNVVSNNNFDGFSIHDVEFLTMKDVDAMMNRNDGFQIIKYADDEYDPSENVRSFVSQVVLTTTRACKNGGDGMEFFARKDSWNGEVDGRLNFIPNSGVISCENFHFDFEIRAHGNITITPLSSAATPNTEGIMGDSCRQSPGDTDCRDYANLDSCQPGICEYDFWM
jgi:hypothetical protein